MFLAGKDSNFSAKKGINYIIFYSYFKKGHNGMNNKATTSCSLLLNVDDQDLNGMVGW